MRKARDSAIVGAGRALQLHTPVIAAPAITIASDCGAEPRMEYPMPSSSPAAEALLEVDSY
jgi:hypothetical protein